MLLTVRFEDGAQDGEIHEHLDDCRKVAVKTFDEPTGAVQGSHEPSPECEFVAVVSIGILLVLNRLGLVLALLTLVLLALALLELALLALVLVARFLPLVGSITLIRIRVLLLLEDRGNNLNNLPWTMVIKLTPERGIETTESLLHVRVSEVLIAGVADLDSLPRGHQDGPSREAETQSTGPADGDRLTKNGGQKWRCLDSQDGQMIRRG